MNSGRSPSNAPAANPMAEAPIRDDGSIAVVIPTRSRPRELAACLSALAVARELRPFPAYICDSSPDEADRRAVREVCERYDWVRLRPHDGGNAPAARNACVQAAEEDILVCLDDDIEVEPEAIERLLDVYRAGSGWRVVAGSLSWDGTWTRPRKMRPIGYARETHEGEPPDFILSGFFVYPRALGLALPWNENIAESEDIFMGALWRSEGVQLLFAPEARALHPFDFPSGAHVDHVDDTVDHERWHIYVLLFDALIANPSLRRFLSYETLGFLAAAKLYFRRPSWAARFVWNWIEGHGRLLADWRQLRAMTRPGRLPQ